MGAQLQRRDFSQRCIPRLDALVSQAVCIVGIRIALDKHAIQAGASVANEVVAAHGDNASVKNLFPDVDLGHDHLLVIARSREYLTRIRTDDLAVTLEHRWDARGIAGVGLDKEDHVLERARRSKRQLREVIGVIVGVGEVGPACGTADDVRTLECADASGLGEADVVTDDEADFADLGVENLEVIASDMELALGKREVHLAVLADIPFGTDEYGAVMSDGPAIGIRFRHAIDDVDAMLLGELSHKLGTGALGNKLRCRNGIELVGREELVHAFGSQAGDAFLGKDDEVDYSGRLLRVPSAAVGRFLPSSPSRLCGPLQTA